jgi:hypothetical protein
MGRKWKKGSANHLAQMVANNEGLKVEVNIAQIKEVLKVARRLIKSKSGSDIYLLWKL